MSLICLFPQFSTVERALLLRAFHHTDREPGPLPSLAYTTQNVLFFLQSRAANRKKPYCGGIIPLLNRCVVL